MLSDKRLRSVYALCSMLYRVSRGLYISQYPPIHPLSSSLCKAFLCSTTVRKRSYSYPHVIKPSFAQRVQDGKSHSPSSSLSLLDSYVLLSSTVSRCRVSILWNPSFRPRMRFHRPRRQTCRIGIQRFSSQYLQGVC